MGFWNDENIESAVALWEDGLSASKIADLIGAASKNVIIGKINRMRIAGHPFKRESAAKGTRERARVSRAGGKARVAMQKVNAKPKAPKAPKKPKPNNVAAVNMARRAERDAAKAEALPPSPVIFDATFAKPWTERLFGECAFPILGDGADTVSCCIRTGGKTYCSGHAKVMFRPVPKIEKQSARAVMRRAA